jgi:hypothetical protein
MVCGIWMGVVYVWVGCVYWVWGMIVGVVGVVKDVTVITIMPVSIVPDILSLIMPPILLTSSLLLNLTTPSSPTSTLHSLLYSIPILATFTYLFPLLNSILFLPSPLLHIIICLLFISSHTKNIDMLAMLIILNMNQISVMKSVCIMYILGYLGLYLCSFNSNIRVNGVIV